jgi:hypothetical protein
VTPKVPFAIFRVFGECSSEEQGPAKHAKRRERREGNQGAALSIFCFGSRCSGGITLIYPDGSSKVAAAFEEGLDGERSASIEQVRDDKITISSRQTGLMSL